MKKFYLFFILLIIAILGGTVVFFYQWNKPKKEIATQEADFKNSISEFAAEFVTDSASANKKYLNKIVVLAGIINESETDPAGNINLIFKESGIEVQCALDSLSSLKAKTLQQQDSVRLKGNYVGVLHDEIFGVQVKLNNCVIEQ